MGSSNRATRATFWEVGQGGITCQKNDLAKRPSKQTEERFSIPDGSGVHQQKPQPIEISFGEILEKSDPDVVKDLEFKK